MAELKRRRSKYAYLPDEILSNILVRLPVKHILRFKTVCRPWRALITSNDFVKLHLNYSKQTPCPEDGALIFMGKKDKSLYVASLASKTRFQAVKLNLVGRLDIVNIIGCCNGLVLCQLELAEKQYVPDLVLVNPSTLHYTRLPTMLPSLSLVRYYEAIGFGYDHITDDYKVVVVVLNDEHEDETFIYSSRADSWRKFTGHMPVIRSIISYSKGVLLNNHLLHWYIRDTHQVYCFDITTEKWSEIPLPVRSGKSVDVVTDMVVQNGLLFISGGWYKDRFTMCGDKLTTCVWVMKEYGVKDSWAKLLNKPHQLGDGRGGDWWISPIANYVQGSDGDEIWLMKLESGTTTSTIKWYAIREGKLGLFTPTIRFQSNTLVKECYTGCNRTLVNL